MACSRCAPAVRRGESPCRPDACKQRRLLNRGMMRRTYRVIMAAVPVLLVAADVVHWRIASERLRGGLQDWIEARRAEGWDIEAGPIALGGWPRAATVTVADLHVRHSGNDIPGVVDWLSPGTTLSVSLYLPTELNLSFSGPQHVRIGAAPDTVITGEAMTAVVQLGPDAPQAFDLHANGDRVAGCPCRCLRRQRQRQRRGPDPAERRIRREHGGDHAPGRLQMAAGPQ